MTACAYLADDVLVGDTDNQAVLGAVVLVLGLNNKALAGVVVGLALCEHQVPVSDCMLVCKMARSDLPLRLRYFTWYLADGGEY